jgi:hypothetical protein
MNGESYFALCLINNRGKCTHSECIDLIPKLKHSSKQMRVFLNEIPKEKVQNNFSIIERSFLHFRFWKNTDTPFTYQQMCMALLLAPDFVPGTRDGAADTRTKPSIQVCN